MWFKVVQIALFFFSTVQLTISQHWFKNSLAPTCYCLNQWWPTLLTHTWVTGPCWTECSVSDRQRFCDYTQNSWFASIWRRIFKRVLKPWVGYHYDVVFAICLPFWFDEWLCFRIVTEFIVRLPSRRYMLLSSPVCRKPEPTQSSEGNRLLITAMTVNKKGRDYTN